MVDLKAMPYNLSDDDINWVKKTIKEMSDEEKVGQLFFQLTASQEEEYLRQVHKYYRELKIYRNPHAISEELRKASAVLAEPYLTEVLKEIKLTPHRASILARREELLMQTMPKKEVEGDAK